jgi:hypothetical protein
VTAVECRFLLAMSLVGQQGWQVCHDPMLHRPVGVTRPGRAVGIMLVAIGVLSGEI